MKEKVLFVCIHNSARSVMAEAYLNLLGKDRYLAESAGLEKGQLNPIVIEVMREDGLDISRHQPRTVAELLTKNRSYHTVITVCDQARGEQCPWFPGQARRLHYEFADPSALEGSFEYKLQRTREIRDFIKLSIQEFIQGDIRESRFTLAAERPDPIPPSPPL